MKWKKTAPKTDRGKALAKLDKVFSLYIRQRDSENGVFKCISCGQIKPYDQCDCGHYINRQHISTRFDEKNCNAQCRKCNRFEEGNAQGYRRGLIEKYGEKADELLEMKKFNTSHLNLPEIEILTKYYKEKIKELSE